MKLDSIQIGGPYDFHLIDESGRRYWLTKADGEWRLDGLWVARGKVDRWDALARACRIIETNQLRSI